MICMPCTQQQYCLFKLSRSTWRRRGAAKLASLHYNEETVTEVLLLDLFLKFPGKVMIVPFTKHRESRKGADWAWTFVGRDGCSNQGMLVQAKRLNDDDQEYESLYKKTQLKGETRPKLQVGRLIDSARRNSLPPVYAFYNHLNDQKRLRHRQSSALRCRHWHFPECWGVALASAFKVRNADPDNSFDCHIQHSIPLHCILCSRWNGQQGPMDSPRTVAAALSRLFKGDTDADEPGSDIKPPFEPSDELPPLFQAAIRLHQSRQEGDEATIRELGEEFHGLAGAVIFRDGEE